MKNDCQIMRNFTCGIDINPYLKNCNYDLCSHDGTAYQNTYVCQAMAAYAFDCAKSGTNIDWMCDPHFKAICSNFGACPTDQKFIDCSNTCLKTCRDLSVSELNVCGSKCNQG